MMNRFFQQFRHTALVILHIDSDSTIISAIVKFDLREMCQTSSNFDLRFCMNINAFLVDLSIVVPGSPLLEVKSLVLSDVFR